MVGLLLAEEGRGGSWRSPGKPCHGVLQLPVHKSGVLRYPYFSTPTGAPGPGPYTVPSVVGPGPNSARARVAWVALLLNSVPAAPSPGGARLSRRRGGGACEVCVTWVACAGLNPAGMLKEICPRGNNKVIIYFLIYHDKCLLFMLELYYPET